LDLPVLLENDGQALKEDLGITSSLQRKQIIRAIKIKLLAVADGISFALLFSRSRA
jgi:hypothetical protein